VARIVVVVEFVGMKAKLINLLLLLLRCSCWRKRHLGYLLCFLRRLVLGVAVVAMFAFIVAVAFE
jgi:hypothetical protein